MINDDHSNTGGSMDEEKKDAPAEGTHPSA